MSRDPKDLTEQMQGFYARFKAKMDAAGQRFILTATYRPQVEQDALFAQGALRNCHNQNRSRLELIEKALRKDGLL